jgi:hypothetical protein
MIQMMHPTLCEIAYQAVEQLSKETESYEMMRILISPIENVGRNYVGMKIRDIWK